MKRKTVYVKYILIVAMLLSFIIASIFVGLGEEIGTVMMGYEHYSSFADSQIQINSAGNMTSYLLVTFVFIVPVSLLASWYCYFSEHYLIGIFLAFIPIIQVGLILFLTFPASEYGKLLSFWLGDIYGWFSPGFPMLWIIASIIPAIMLRKVAIRRR